MDFSELLKRAIKYIVEGIMVAIAAYAIPKKKLDIDEILSFIKRDKKYEKGKLKFVILKKMGHAGVTTNIDDKLLRESIKIL